MVYTAMGKPAEYEGISLVFFISGYLAVMATEKPSIHSLMLQHCQDLMSDVELYNWELVRAFHAIRLQQLEQGRVTWANEHVKLKYRRALVWHCAAGLSQAAQPGSSSTMCQQSWGKEPMKGTMMALAQTQPPTPRS